MKGKTLILVVVDDEKFIRDLLTRHLHRCFDRPEVNITGTPDFACDIIMNLIRHDRRPDLVFTGFDMRPHGNGLPVIQLCKKLGVPVILICSPDQNHEDFRTARELVGESFIAKPAEGFEIKEMAERILGFRS